MINSDLDGKEQDLREMIDSYLQNLDMLLMCRKKRCKGKCTTQTSFVPGTDIFIININRVSGHDHDIVANSKVKFSRRRSTVNIPLRGLVISGNPYNLIMVIHQEAYTGEDGEDDPLNGHYYVHKRVTHNRHEHFWVLLDDDTFDMKNDEEMINEIKVRNDFVSTLVYKRELSFWDSASSSGGEQLYL